MQKSSYLLQGEKHRGRGTGLVKWHSQDSGLFLPDFFSIYSFTTRPFSLKNSRRWGKRKRKRNHSPLKTTNCTCGKTIPGAVFWFFTGQRRWRSCQSAWNTHYHVSSGWQKEFSRCYLSFSLNITSGLPAAEGNSWCAPWAVYSSPQGNSISFLRSSLLSLSDCERKRRKEGNRREVRGRGEDSTGSQHLSDAQHEGKGLTKIVFVHMWDHPLHSNSCWVPLGQLVMSLNLTHH